MGLLNLFGKSGPLRLERMPAGTFTLNDAGAIVACTLPHDVPRSLMEDIGRRVQTCLNEAPQQDQNPLRELVVHFTCLKLTARRLGDGAIVHLSPIESAAKPNATSGYEQARNNDRKS